MSAAILLPNFWVRSQGHVSYGYTIYPHWKRTDDQAAKLAVFATGPAIRNTFSNLISEIIGTAMLVLALLFIGTNEFTGGLNPIAVGLLIVAIGVGLGGTTGFAINPARDLGRALPMPSFQFSERDLQTGNTHGYR